MKNECFVIFASIFEAGVSNGITTKAALIANTEYKELYFASVKAIAEYITDRKIGTPTNVIDTLSYSIEDWASVFVYKMYESYETLVAAYLNSPANQEFNYSAYCFKVFMNKSEDVRKKEKFYVTEKKTTVDEDGNIHRRSEVVYKVDENGQKVKQKRSFVSTNSPLSQEDPDGATMEDNLMSNLPTPDEVVVNAETTLEQNLRILKYFHLFGQNRKNKRGYMLVYLLDSLKILEDLDPAENIKRLGQAMEDNPDIIVPYFNKLLDRYAYDMHWDLSQVAPYYATSILQFTSEPEELGSRLRDKVYHWRNGNKVLLKKLASS